MIMKKISAALMINILASAMHSYFEDNNIGANHKMLQTCTNL